MFGYVVANKDDLTEAGLLRYRACYCGLCRNLKDRYGGAGRITLTYDMTFLIVLLSALYEPECREGTERCMVHPVKPHAYWQNRFTDYAADMNIVLAYHNCMDDWADDKNVAALAEATFLKKKYRRLEEKYPRQCGAVASCLKKLALIEKENRMDPDAAANCCGEMMGELVVPEEDRWSPGLRKMAAALGRFIYIMDAYEDVGADVKKRRYNPLALLYGENGYEETCRDILTMHIGECAMEFEKLPIVQDADILRNILYSGVWSKYTLMEQKKRKGTQENGKSI